VVHWLAWRLASGITSTAQWYMLDAVRLSLASSSTLYRSARKVSHCARFSCSMACDINFSIIFSFTLSCVIFHTHTYSCEECREVLLSSGASKGDQAQGARQGPLQNPIANFCWLLNLSIQQESQEFNLGWYTKTHIDQMSIVTVWRTLGLIKRTYRPTLKRCL